MTAIIVYPEIEAFGGEERVLLGLSRSLHNRGVAHRIVSYFDHVGLQDYADWPLDHVVLTPPGGAWSKGGALKAYLAAQRPTGRVLFFGMQAAAHAGLRSLQDYSVRIADTPSLLHLSPRIKGLRRLMKRAQGEVLLFFAGRGLRRADSVVVNADYLGEELWRRCGIQTTTIYIGTKPAPNLAPSALADRIVPKIHLLSVARLEPNKRIDWLIEAFGDAVQGRSNGSSLVLDIAGTGAEAEALKALCAKHRLDGQVRFHGFVSDEALEHLYGDAAAFVMPAVQGFGLPALEALIRGTPVVMHRQSGASEILAGTPWVTVFDGGKENLAKAINEMIDRLQAGVLNGTKPPKVPMEDDFGRQVAQHCGWLTS